MAGNAPHIPGCRDLSLIGERVARSLFSATSDRIGRPVTVTVFPPLSEGRTRDGFDRAAATAQRLGAHPSVLTIHEWGHADDGRPWIVTDPQPPESVDTLLMMDGPLEVDRALQVGVLLAGALETAHRAGIVHGDLSPARLVFGAHGEPLVAETGLAAFAVFPGLGALNNPVRYHAPPEVLERTEIGPATDVYSLATTVYALLAGRAPQQKPAEITDSNASLLLRILQMPVPLIDRRDLPAGLDDALRGPLSPSPDRRPQHAIDVAWLLQDVQRRAGFAITEPVVLDLDDLRAGGPHARPRAPATPTMGAPADSPAPFESSPFTPPSFEPKPPPASPVAGAPPGEPWAPAPEPGADPWSPSSPGPMGAPALPVDPVPESFAAPDLPPPTIFPFAQGLDASGAEPPPAHEQPAEPLWPSEASSEPPADALWPSSWPAVDQPVNELPAWAAPPANGDAPPEPGVALGDDGGSIGDLGGVRPANGHGNAGAPVEFALPDRPPELDELPAWYTDPLPNAGDEVGTNGAEGHHGHGQAPPPDDGSPWGDPAGSNGHTAPSFDPPPSDPPSPGGFPPVPSRSQGGQRLPGAGDELRSLFGEVVGDDDDLDQPASRRDAGGPTYGAAAGVGTPAGPATDPLGPPRDRPPIDLSQLDAPLGPSPYLPSRGKVDDAGQDRPARLPRRHEVASRQPPAGSDAGSPDVSRLPRATDPRAGRPAGQIGAGAHGTDESVRLERPAPRQTAPDRDRQPNPTSAAMAGPPALPVLVLIAVVAVLVLSVAWLVITGDDAEAPASDRPAAEDAEAGSDGEGAAGAPTGVKATPVPEGIQVSWTGVEGVSYVVTILAPDQPPEILPAAVGTSALVPNVQLGPGAGRCFTVAAADAQGAAGPQSAPACTPGAAVDGMQAG